jgi:serine/threonine protein kinase
MQAVMNTLEGIRLKITSWAKLNRFEAFAMQNEIQEDTLRCHNQISDCLGKFQVISHLEIHDWQSQFESNHKLDHDEIISYLAEISNSQDITLAVTVEGFAKTMAFMSNMQQALSETPTGHRVNAGLQSNLYQVQMDTKTLLPEFNLNRGEVTRIGQFAVSGSASTDIWEGLYLGREKVAIKVIRSVTSDPRSLKRFKREVKVWGELWKIDGGRHLLPFYGFCQNDGPYPYTVSPWQPNGTAINYVKKYPDIDYVQMIRSIGEGIRILHSMDPPVVHGDIKGSNIFINAQGHPLIADFGVSRIVEDITGVPFSQSNGVSDSYRWFSPELYVGTGSLSTSSDIYAYAMTMLELITNQQPYSYIKHTTEVVIKSSTGARPRRPTEPYIIARGLDDNLWGLMTTCWNDDPTARPSIDQVLAQLP